MRLTHEIAIDHDSNIPGATEARLQQVLDVIGHDPVNCSFVAASQDAIVHGRLIEILWCDTRILGFEYGLFRDGVPKLLTEQNIDQWFKDQVPYGKHRLMKIEGHKAFGNTVIKLQITSVDEAPTRQRKTTFMRPSKSVAREVIEKRLAALT